MKLLVIYNEHDARELDILERIRQEAGNMVDELGIIDMTQAREQYPLLHVRATPAIYPIRDDLQGDYLMQEGADSKLILTALVAKELQEEESAIHQQQTHRLDNVVNAQAGVLLEPVREAVLPVLAQTLIPEQTIRNSYVAFATIAKAYVKDGRTAHYAGELIESGGIVYMVQQPFVAHWDIGADTLALATPVLEPGEAPRWIYGGKFALNAKCTHNGAVYKATVAQNSGSGSIWEPGAPGSATVWQKL